MNEIRVTVCGNVVAPPREVRFQDGNSETTFRLASTSRRFDAQRREWVDGRTTWITVRCRRSLARNVTLSLQKGERVLVSGKLVEREWSTDERSGRVLELHADSLGHDLTFGVSRFLRMSGPMPRPEQAPGPVLVSSDGVPAGPDGGRPVSRDPDLDRDLDLDSDLDPDRDLDLEFDADPATGPDRAGSAA